MPGWSYESMVDVVCPRCHGALHTMRKPYESAGKTYRYVAVVCPACPASFTLPDLGLKTHSDLLARGSARGAAASVTARGDTSIPGLAEAQWGVRPSPVVARFALPGWEYLRETDVACPGCAGSLHGFSRVYEQKGQPRVQAALVCPTCPATFTTRQLKVPRANVVGEVRAGLLAAPASDSTDRAESRPRNRWAPQVPGRRDRVGGSRRGSARVTDLPGMDCSSSPGLRVRAVSAGEVASWMLGTSRDRDRGRQQGVGPVRVQAVKPPVEARWLYWRKIANPASRLPSLPVGTDVRVLLPTGPAFDPLRQDLADVGIAVRSVAQWVEDEIISTVDPGGGEVLPLSVTVALTSAGGLHAEWGARVVDQPAYDARDAFEVIWDAHGDDLSGSEPPYVPASELVPGEWLGYLPYATLNPAQAQAAPLVLGTNDHLVVTAPTGAGKTVVGMLAVLRAILAEGRKAAWLVPQRSLTDELDRELEAWRGKGLRVERLSGEYSVDIEKVREADLWVATTEKFEAMCRASSLQTALAEVGCMVVDEIHLLGAAARGPLLEALLARVRGVDSPVRIVGLSATVSNAGEIAEWLDGELVTTTWRPSRLTWQLPMIPASSDRKTDAALRTRVAVDLAQRVAGDGGSVLVFCGTKPNVRATALAIAAARGQNITGVHLDDIDRVHQLCAAAGVGLHYKDWEFKREAETRFRNRDWDVLVATTTVAAGVNLPARAVVVRDTRVGLDDLDVATVLQMFGRAGRVGAGEREGFAYLITTENERANWQGALVDGYTVYSQIHDTLPDHVLAEVLQGRITSIDEAEQWWLRTLCHHQGDEDTEPVTDAVDFLLDAGYLSDVTRPDQTDGVAVTELGKLTARLMVGTRVGAQLRADLATLPVPSDPDTAEDWLIESIATLVPELAGAPVAEPLRPTVATIRKAGGRRDLIGSTTAVTGLGAGTAIEPGDLAQAALMLVARSPELFARTTRIIAGIPASTLYPVLDAAPRYLGWLAAQGYLATIHPWIAVVAADLGRRVRWRRCAPPRGAGRLLWMCEHMAGPIKTNDLVPQLLAAATSRGITAPDWPHATPPRHCQLTQADYTALLRERTTGTQLTITDGHVHATHAITGTLTTWTGHTTHTLPITGTTTTECPAPGPDPTDTSPRGAAVFTKRGDHTATGWLADHYTAAHVPGT